MCMPIKGYLGTNIGKMYSDPLPHVRVATVVSLPDVCPGGLV
jgi:hypothetical protein